MLKSRPNTSARSGVQTTGPASSGIKPSGRTPAQTSRSATPGTASTGRLASHSWPACTRALNTLMGGVPRKRATNRLAGSSYTCWGLPSCMSTPSFITTIWSEMLMASSWSWVTNRVVIPVFF